MFLKSHLRLGVLIMILIKDLNFSYKKDKEILKNINLNINDNEVILISGISGSGKSTLFNCFNGLIPHFYNGILSGDIIINLNNTKDLALHEISEHVGSVFQDPRSQFFTTDTTDEISFVCQNMAMDKDEIFKKVDDVFSFFSIEYLKDKNIFKLSSGEKQKIAIASAAVISPSIYIFDEPSANLDFDSINKLSELFRLLKKEGHTVIIIEHRIYYLKDLFDKMIHMDGGEIKKVYSISDMSKMSNFDFNHLGLRSFDMDKIDFKNNETYINVNHCLELKNISFSYLNANKIKNRLSFHKKSNQRKILNNINLKVFGGEVLGLIGENGAGKTTLAKIISGLLKENSGEVLINNNVKSDKDRLKSSYFVMQDSDYQLFENSVKKELELANLDVNNLNEKIEILAKKLQLYDCLENHPTTLSRGQKQRLTIACSILSKKNVIIFDEPTSGLDYNNMKYVCDLILDLSKQGKIIFIISHDFEFLLEVSTRILYLKESRILKDFKLNNENIDLFKKLLLGGKHDSENS